ncbi:MAG: hypothetical protein JST09_20410 [Bacteroidetes bacterium]|nr:hypothetical protein [Bacteroidota bacterium]
MTQLRHKRFTETMLKDALSSLRCYWYPQVKGSIVPIGNENDSKHQRPDCIHT